MADVVPFLIYKKGAGEGELSNDTLGKVNNSDVQTATWAGGSNDVFEKVDRYAKRQVRLAG